MGGLGFKVRFRDLFGLLRGCLNSGVVTVWFYRVYERPFWPPGLHMCWMAKLQSRAACPTDSRRLSLPKDLNANKKINKTLNKCTYVCIYICISNVYRKKQGATEKERLRDRVKKKQYLVVASCTDTSLP